MLDEETKDAVRRHLDESETGRLSPEIATRLALLFEQEIDAAADAAGRDQAELCDELAGLIYQCRSVEEIDATAEAYLAAVGSDAAGRKMGGT
ncbi:hypothetical protein [Arenibaculum pallidiluteum]|uniref:hypothetical protein n=1 Tax=Arenibaculum pallidiluteum TaxID=2812559 RepID=UPI001A963C83|nr:hypothetical protein [Arenibaculum pallidiluteum]